MQRQQQKPLQEPSLQSNAEESQVCQRQGQSFLIWGQSRGNGLEGVASKCIDYYCHTTEVVTPHFPNSFDHDHTMRQKNKESQIQHALWQK